MSKYTTEIRWIVEQTIADNKITVPGNNPIIACDMARPYIFDFQYPSFSDAQKQELETKILLHYYTREIGLETYGLWKLKLATKLRDIMPYYVQLYDQVSKDIDPYGSVDYTITKNGEYGKGTYDQRTGGATITSNDTTTNDLTNTGSGTSKEISSNSTIDRFNDTPQGMVGYTTEDDKTYLTNYRIVNENGTTDNTYNNTSKDTGTVNRQGRSATDDNTKITHGGSDTLEETTHTKGKMNNEPNIDIIMRVRESFLNIDAMIIQELEPLFMQLW